MTCIDGSAQVGSSVGSPHLSRTDDLEARAADVAALLAAVLGDGDLGSERCRAARALSEAAVTTLGLEPEQLVYAELDVGSVARILDAVDVEDDDRFLDIGCGDGLPTFAAALLYPDRFRACRGVEIVSELVGRAEANALQLRRALHDGPLRAAPIEFFRGDIYRATRQPRSRVAGVLRDTTLALCFATTWSHEPRRTLSELSQTLSETMPAGARVVLVDARLVEGDGWRWEGDLRITTPDTAPYSTARLYVRVT
ncbi:MAG TPA: hypothetical protein ENK57_12645 [Polyangiaceae bacterium]|nr:hypothetical protein [Polyangiaceae bacterium]